MDSRYTEKLATFRRLFDLELEQAICDWLRLLIGENHPKCFVDLFDRRSILEKSISATGVKKISARLGVHSGSSHEELVKFLAEVFRKGTGVEVFELFRPIFNETFNNRFVFERDYDSVMYSHSEIVGSVVALVLCLCIAWTKSEKCDTGCDEVIHDLSEKSKKKVQHCLITAEELWSVTPKAQISEIKGVQSDSVLTQVVETQETEIKLLEARLQDESEKLIEAQTNIQSLSKQLEEAKVTIKKLEFSKDDLVAQVRQKAREQETEIMQERERDSARAREELYQVKTELNRQIQSLQLQITLLEKKSFEFDELKKEYGALKSYNDHLGSLVNSGLFREKPANEEEQKLQLELSKLQRKVIEQESKMISILSENQQLKKRVWDLENAEESTPSSPARNEESIVFIKSFKLIQEELSISQILEVMKSSSAKAKDNHEFARFTVNELLTESCISATMSKKARTSVDHLEEITNDKINQNLNKDQKNASHLERMLTDFRNKCLKRIKALCLENRNCSALLKQQSAQIDSLTLKKDELLERLHGLEDEQVNLYISKCSYLREYFEGDFTSETLQSISKQVLKKELEIGRLKHLAKKSLMEALKVEAKANENVGILCEVVMEYCLKK